MRGNEFLDKMELVDPTYVEEADEHPPKARTRWFKWGGLAACLCLAAAAVFTLTGLEPMTLWYKLTGTYNPALVEAGPKDWTDDGPAVTVPGPDGPTIDIDTPEARTSDTYSSLSELLDYLRLHDGHGAAESTDGYKGGLSTAHAAMEGSDTVSWNDTVYQLNHDTAKWVGIYQDGVLVGTLDAPADYLFLSDGRLVTAGAEYYSGTELNPVYCVRVNIFDPVDPAHPVKLDTFTQLGNLTACWINNGTLYLLTDDGVCACGYSRFSNLEDYRPQLFHKAEQIPWPEEYISILGTPSRVSYVAAACIDVVSQEVTGQRAFYGDIGDVFFGEDWLALVTESAAEGGSYTLQEVYAFGDSFRFAGKCDVASVFGLEKAGALADGSLSPPERPDVKAVTRAGSIWRMVGEYYRHTENSWARDLFAITFDPETGETANQTLQLQEAQFSIDDVFWEENRAIISAGHALFGQGPDDFSQGTRLAFAEFDGMSITLLSSDILCDRVRGIDMMYSYGSPLGYIRPFIPLACGWYLRYNETPNGFDIYDFSDSRNPVCIYKSQGDIPEGCRLDFDYCVLYTNGAASGVAVKLITPRDGGYRHPDYSWCIFSVDEEPPVVPRVSPERYPVTGFDPASLIPSEP